MPTLADIFKDPNIRETLVQFKGKHLDRIENGLFEKNAKPYLRCLLTDKEKVAKKEEVIRQLWLLTLIDTYRYPSFAASTSKTDSPISPMYFMYRKVLVPF